MTADLRKLAEAATPGPWEWHDNGEDEWQSISSPLGVGDVVDRLWERADAAYIAALAPDVVLALLDVVEAARDLDDTMLRPDEELRAALARLDEVTE